MLVDELGGIITVKIIGEDNFTTSVYTIQVGRCRSTPGSPQVAHGLTPG